MYAGHRQNYFTRIDITDQSPVQISLHTDAVARTWTIILYGRACVCEELLNCLVSIDVLQLASSHRAKNLLGTFTRKVNSEVSSRYQGRFYDSCISDGQSDFGIPSTIRP